MRSAEQTAALTREAVLELLDRFNRQRPGLEIGNYGTRAGYLFECRSIARTKREAGRLIADIAISSMPVETLLDGFRAYSGRLSITFNKSGKPLLEYCTGQYFPTEYRSAVAAVCSSALWMYFRDDFAATRRPSESDGDAIRRCFRQRYGVAIARRWFS